MRLPVDAPTAFVAFFLSAAVAGCGLLPGSGARPGQLTLSAPAATGPAADYPMVLGDPFTIDGEVYTPADTLNYDAVGYATLDAGQGVTAAHRTLPLPSYIEVTSLDTGKTILARVERRGPTSGSRLLALSPAAATQLGAREGAPVRVRRVNPQESLRAELRAGHAAPEPIETPKSLVEVLRRKLPPAGAAVLRPAVAQHAARTGATANSSPPASTAGTAAAPASHALAPVKLAAAGAIEPAPASKKPAAAKSPAPSAPAPLPTSVGNTSPKPVPKASPGSESFVVQAGAFSQKANADRAARSIGGFVTPSGKLFLVRTGPFADRKQADAALAKVRAAGYSDARVFTPS